MGWDNKHKIFIKFCKLCISAAIPDGICSPAPTACQWISRTIRLFVCLFICFCFVVLMCQTCNFLVLIHHQWKKQKTFSNKQCPPPISNCAFTPDAARASKWPEVLHFQWEPAACRHAHILSHTYTSVKCYNISANVVVYLCTLMPE